MPAICKPFDLRSRPNSTTAAVGCLPLAENKGLQTNCRAANEEGDRQFVAGESPDRNAERHRRDSSNPDQTWITRQIQRRISTVGRRLACGAMERERRSRIQFAASVERKRARLAEGGSSRRNRQCPRNCIQRDNPHSPLETSTKNLAVGPDDGWAAPGRTDRTSEHCVQGTGIASSQSARTGASLELARLGPAISSCRSGNRVSVCSRRSAERRSGPASKAHRSCLEAGISRGNSRA